MDLLHMLDDLTIGTENIMYTYVLTAVLIIVSVYFSFRTKFVQIRLFPDAIKAVIDRKKGTTVSSFQALMISTAARVGTGCIAGIATAIVTGGPGAVLWMWVIATVASSMTFIECTLAQMYKVKDGNGFRGGPAYYIERVLGKRWFAVCFSVFLVLCFGYGLNALQSHMISNSISEYIPGYNDNRVYTLIVGVVLCILTSMVIFGGIHRIGFVSSYLVPVMAIGYICMGIVISIMNFTRIPSMLYDIFNQALNFKAISLGALGVAVMEGLKKGLVSHESGMGSAANAAASADVTHPVKQGMGQVFSVFITTFLVCTTTAFMVLLSGIDLRESGLEDIALVQAVVRSQIGRGGDYFMTLSVFFFAFSSIIGNYSYAETNILFIKNSKRFLYGFRATCLCAVFLGAISSSSIVWRVAQILMGFMAFVNVLSIILIRNRAFVCMNDYIKQKKEGKDPVFKAKEVGITDTDMWN